jgi:hypothetical protein
MDWERLAKDQAKRRLTLWLLFGGGGAVVGGIFLVIVVIAVAAVFLAGVGYWISGLFVGQPPPMGTPTARSLEWLSAVQRADPALPAALGLAVIAQASGGEVYGDRYYCVQSASEQSSGLPCGSAFGKGWKTLGESYGLMGLDEKDVALPKAGSADTPHTVAWNVPTGIHRLAQSLAQAGDLQAALPAFHRSTQAPPGWIFSHYRVTIRQDIQTYGGPQMAVWAIAKWGKLSGTYQDSSGAKDWVIAVAAAPTGPAWSLEWKPPTVKYIEHTKTVPTTKTVRVKVLVPSQTQIVTTNVSVNGKTITTHHLVHTKAHTVTKSRVVHGTKTVHYVVREVITHDLTGHALEQPLSIAVTLNNGQTTPLQFSAQPHSPVPVWPGGQIWGGQFDLNDIRTVTAVWPGLRETIPWPPASNQADGTIHLVNETQSIGGWWPDIEQASRQTGTPASLIAAIMVHESGGDAAAYNAEGPAYGLMQILPSTAQGLPGYQPATWTSPQENLILGAELLKENEQATGGWHAAVAAYYGGLGTMEAAGYTPGMPWSEASVLLNVVPAAYAGNTQTMTSYADQMMAESAIIAAHESTKPARGQ